jgi:Rubisco accumulation factor 1 alpha helical domain/Rubisco Assembly chaperone C-terminal domain/Rubisco accumulation factor 1 helix turn helix domain
MTEIPPIPPENQPEAIDAKELLQLLRRKEQNWFEWGMACQQLNKAGYTAQVIFEETGFEPIQQNQLIVASQVYTTLLNVGVSESVRSRFERTGSDSLYELRILAQDQRAAAAEFIVARNLDSEGSREVAKAVKEFARRSNLPEGFSNHPGDAVAYEYWKVAKQQNDIQDRSRLIARGLMFAHTQAARQQVEKLLTELLGGKSEQAPRLPFYRVEAEDSLPRLLSVVGQLPITTDLLTEFPQLNTLSGSFPLVKVSALSTLVAIPGWQIILKAKDAVVIACKSDQLPTQGKEKVEDVLLVVDRANKTWEKDNFFAVDNAGQVEIQWFAETPSLPLLGCLILVLRPQQILDENLSHDVWQIDE